MKNHRKQAFGLLLTTSFFALMGCAETTETASEILPVEKVEKVEKVYLNTSVDGEIIDVSLWPAVSTPPLDPNVEAKIDTLISKMTLEQKVGQVIQADSNAVTPEEVKKYRLGSVLSGGNSAPGDLPYADAQAWLDAADAYYAASIDEEGVEVAIPIIWGIDAVHGHTNLLGGIVFPHNVGLGAANDPDLVKRIAEITAIELNVSGHDWTFAPTLAVPQNDRWGRGYEGFSEDPSIVKSYGGAIVDGLQGELGSDEFMGASQVISSAKHFLGDGGTRDGVDQGDAQISQEELRDLHLAGYLTAVEAGAQSVMASFSSWQGQPMHGQKELLTDVLKDRMNFKGFVIGDWNGHALIPGCTATDCPQSLNAGLDMYMAPDTWKGLYESTLEHAKSGRIPMARLDDAVRRILRVKINSGIFEKPKPSARPLSGQVDKLGSEEHRQVAREAVRKSQVLLKNNNQILPLATNTKVHVVGKGADHIGKFAGGWTLSWQGGEFDNSFFPNGESFLSAVKREVEKGGGSVTYDETGENIPNDADVIIAVYGEDPYAEFRGDRETVDFVPNDFDTTLLNQYKAAGIATVSVFLSGRPLWTNPEINASDAFVASWLPGSEPAGITDLLFKTSKDYDFTGRLSFSWPKLATQVKLNKHHENYDPLFALGYGLSLKDNVVVGELSEESGLVGEGIGPKGIFFEMGTVPNPWSFAVNGSNIDLPFNGDGVSAVAYDQSAQEDAVKISLSNSNSVFTISAGYGLDYQRESNGEMELSFEAKRLSGDPLIEVSMGCANAKDCNNFKTIELNDEWSETRIRLSCFENMGYLEHAFVAKSAKETEFGLANVRLKQQSAEGVTCN